MILIEVAIGIFAGYCCCYFISMKLINKEPEKVIEEWMELIESELKK